MRRCTLVSLDSLTVLNAAEQAKATRFRRCRSLAILLASLAAVAFPSRAAEPKETELVKSREVGVDGVEYRVVGNGDALELRSWLAGHEDMAHVEAVDREAFGPGRVRSLALARWFRRGLCAVVELEVEGAHVYHYCVFPERSQTERSRIGGKVWVAKALESPKRLKVVALSGELGGDSLLFVLADLGIAPNGLRSFSSGYIVVDDCPNPPIAPFVTPFKGEAAIVPPEFRKLFGK